MRWAFAFIIGLHGLIHLMGPAKAFGYADLPQLTQPISRGEGDPKSRHGVLPMPAISET